MYFKQIAKLSQQQDVIDSLKAAEELYLELPIVCMANYH